MDQNLGIITLSGRKMHFGRSRACKGAPHEERKGNMSQFERFVTEGTEKADELAKEGALLDKEFTAEARAETMQQEREEVYAALQCAASFHCVVEQWKDCEELKPKPKEKWTFVDKKREETKHRTEWCAEADRYRCMRCGRGSKHMKMPGKMYRTKILFPQIWENGEGVIWEVMTWSEEWTDRERSSYGAGSARDMRGKELDRN